MGLGSGLGFDVAQLGDQRCGGGHRLLDEADDDAREDEEAQAVRHADEEVGEPRAGKGEQQHALPAEHVWVRVRVRVTVGIRVRARF